MSEEVNKTEATQEAGPVQLSLADLAAVVQIIDFASKRGTFDGPELETVGRLRNRFATFVEQQEPAAEQAATAEAEDGSKVEVEVEA